MTRGGAVAFWTLLVLAWMSVSGRSEDLPARVPGTIRIDGSPERFDTARIVPAFPHLRFKRPLYVGHPGDGTDRIFVLEQDGLVWAFENERDVRSRKLVLDLKNKVYRGHNEEGLLGMAFHPNVRENRRVFLHYSARRPRRGVIAEFRMDEERRTILPRSARVILMQRQPFGNHNGGCLKFGPDGYLYISFGDGGWAGDPGNNAQDLSTWLGTMLRIDVDRKKPYALPRDNPFVGKAKARPEIWAYGLRNVWRFSFDRVTGTLWAGDVGQNLYEEIDIIRKGGNYGWRFMEGKHPFRGSTKQELEGPVVEHHKSYARSITGGYVYRGRKIPGLLGAYVYGDYETGNIWALRWDGKKVTEHKLIGRGRSIASFGEDRDGEIYFVSFDGRIYTFEPGGDRDERASFPTRLSETGVFTDVASMKPHPSLVPYAVNMPLWSDGAAKERYIMVPGQERVRVDADGYYSFPQGTIFVKSFFLDGRRLETRLLIHGKDGWAGYTYVWDDAQQEAYLIDGRVDKKLTVRSKGKKVERTWTFPSRSDCMSCHTAVGRFVLGFRPEQLADEDLERMKRLALFDGDPRAGRTPFPDWTKPTDVEASVRAYLDTNCAMCHQPDGPGNAQIDLRAAVPLERTRMIGVQPGQGDLGLRGALLVKPGSPDRSLLYVRMRRTDERGMPNLSHNLPDEKALKLLRRWIRGLK
ncbi:MAG: PQQ-dependent sugar dehydrogenase [Chloroflexi bacterium]|nr:PQQ-dependent sugar dehydrogenase [Chloroflexota bacterium]